MRKKIMLLFLIAAAIACNSMRLRVENKDAETNSRICADTTEKNQEVLNSSKAELDCHSLPIVSATQMKISNQTEISKTEGKTLSYSEYWISASLLNVREEPSSESAVLDKLQYNTKILATDHDKDWMELKGGGYVNKQYIADREMEYISYSIPYTSGFKSFMPHDGFSKKSNQYKLQLSCYTGDYGIRQYNGRYCVALGSRFNAEIGQFFDIVLDNGEVIECVMADMKADCDTDSSNIVTVANGCASEFIVNMSALNPKVKKMGDISYCTEDWKSRVVEILVYDRVITFK